MAGTSSTRKTSAAMVQAPIRSAVVDAYVADPLCGFGIDTESAKGMFVGARRLADPAQLAALRSTLPVYIAVGEADPVNGGLAVLTPLIDRLKEAGLTDVTVVTYPEARHEVLNETTPMRSSSR
jgi:alpha-beta hydrolase superfamily lysophospholipase